MRRVIGLDIHRTFAEAVAWEDGRLIRLGRVDMTCTALEGFGKSLSDEVVVEATGNAMAVVRVLSPFVARVMVANPLQVKAIAHAHVKTDKIDAGVLASLHAAGFLPEVWTPDPETERLRRLVARRNQVVRHRTRIKNEVHSILHAHLIPRCPHADLFNRRGRDWLSRQPLPVDEKATIDRHVRELDRLAEREKVPAQDGQLASHRHGGDLVATPSPNADEERVKRSGRLRGRPGRLHQHRARVAASDLNLPVDGPLLVG